MEIVGDGARPQYYVNKINPQISTHCDVVDIETWGLSTQKNLDKQAELYERFVEIYHSFWKLGLCENKEPDRDAEDPNYDLGPDVAESITFKVPKKDIIYEEEPEPKDSDAKEKEKAQEQKEIDALNSDETRKHIRIDILQLDRPFDKWDCKTPALNELLSNDPSRFNFSRLIYQRRHSGNLKVNDYTGTMKYYILQSKRQDFTFNGRDDIVIQKNEPLAMALLYHWIPISRKSSKAKEFYYLAHIGASTRLRSNGVGYMLFLHLRDNVVGDKPLFLEMEPTSSWKKLCRQYETWGFHTAAEMRSESENKEWADDWYPFFQNACANGWTAVSYNGDVRSIFTPKACAPDNDLWMVYWKKWVKPPLTEAEYRAPYSSVEVDNAMSLTEQAKVSADVLLNSDSIETEVMDEDEESEQRNLLPNQLIALCSDAWREIYTPETTKRKDILDELTQTLFGSKVTYSQPTKFPTTKANFLQPTSIQSGAGRNPLYKFEFRNYLLVAPKSGVLDVEPDTPGANQVPIGIGEPCGFACCILLKPASTECDCPPLWVIDSLGIESKDVANASVEILLRSLLSLIQAAAAQTKMLLLMKSTKAFITEYGWVLRELGFVFGSPNSAHLN